MTAEPEDLRAELSATLRQAPVPIVAAYLFGSHARGDASSASDVDVAVLLAEEGVRSLVGPLPRLSGMLERALKTSVDLVDLRTAPPDLVHRILRDGVLIIDADPLARVAFEVHARNEYFDVLPHLQRYRRHRAA